MAERGSHIALAMLVSALASAAAIAQASAAPVARGAAGNSMTASGTVDTTYGSPTARITGQILASGHKYGPHHCLGQRDIFASAPSVAGPTQNLGDADHPTDNRGRFVFTQVPLDYGKPGISGVVPGSGGTVTITLTATPATAPKKRGDITSSFHCQPVSTTVSVQVPPAPPSFFS
jgi:hypothetical protein